MGPPVPSPAVAEAADAVQFNFLQFAKLYHEPLFEAPSDQCLHHLQVSCSSQAEAQASKLAVTPLMLSEKPAGGERVLAFLSCTAATYYCIFLAVSGLLSSASGNSELMPAVLGASHGPTFRQIAVRTGSASPPVFLQLHMVKI